MQLIELQENTWVIQGGANIGIIAHEGRCLIIDSGIDKDTGQNILKQVKKLGHGNTLFAGDAFLTPEILDKHCIPYMQGEIQPIFKNNCLLWQRVQ
jgi:hypothetical protein